MRDSSAAASAFAAFAGADIAYALDDGMAFPDWVPPLLTDDEARTGYAAGERMAVIAGDPANPVSGLVLDRRNARVAVRNADPALQLSYGGDPLALTEALWWDPEDRQCWARRASAHEVRVARRPRAAAVWVEEFLAYAPGGHEDAPGESLSWPEFGTWSALAALPGPPWVGEGSLRLIDADGWILAALDVSGATSAWRDLGGRYDAPRAFGLPAEIQATLAEPLGWTAVGRKWRKSNEINGVQVVTDAVFSAGAGASGEIVTTVTSGKVKVVVDLPSATARTEMRNGGLKSPSHPRPSTGAQVAVTAILETGGGAHEAIVTAVSSGAVPAGWTAAFG